MAKRINAKLVMELLGKGHVGPRDIQDEEHLQAEHEEGARGHGRDPA